MKSLVLLAVLTFSASIWAREPAHVRLYCNSMRFQPGTSSDQTLTIEFTSDQSLSDINGEVFPTFDPTQPTHGSYFRMQDPTFGDAIPGRIAFDEPLIPDANTNGFDDFFEVSQAVPTTTSNGIFSTALDSGTVTATWSRAAGSSTGTCQIQLKGTQFGQLSPVTFTFEILEYQGSLTYVPGTNSISGMLSLAQTLASSNTLSGPVIFTRVATNRLDELTLLSGTFTNRTGLTWSYQNADILRDTKVNTNYYGYVDFADGDPSNATPDYIDWVISIDDPNDSNGNGIPDLSDDLGGTPITTQPALALTLSGKAVSLTITNGSGHTYTLESATALPSTNWTKGVSLTVTNDPQTVSLPLPTVPVQFWRLLSTP